MRKSTLHRIAIVVVAVVLGSATTDAVARGGGGAGHGGGGMGGGHFGGVMGDGHFGGGIGRGFGGHFGGAVAGGRIGGGLRGGHFGGDRFAGRFEHSHRVRGPVVPFGYYDDWYSGYGNYDPSTVTPDEQPTYPTAAYPYVKPRSSCSTQTYKVPSEAGGEASINVVRC